MRVVPATEGDDYLGGVPSGMQAAVATFLVGSAIRRLRGDQSRHSMLIHNSNLRSDHSMLRDAVVALIQRWREALSLRDSDPAASDILDLMRSAYVDIRNTLTNAPDWPAVAQQVRQEVRLVETWMVNSLPQGSDPIRTPFRLRNNILVGGNMLGRGVTIPDLAVTYVTRRAEQTNADTVEQRARWFGYKAGYLDVTRIYLTPQLRDDYTELLRHEDDFWDSLERNERQGLSVREWPRMLALDMETGLRPTRSNVAMARQFQGQGWEIQNRIVDDPTIAGQNVEVVRGFFARPTVEVRRYGGVEHLVIPSCSPDEVIAGLLTRLNLEGTDWESSYVVEYLQRLVIGGRLMSMDVVLMSRGGIRDRRLYGTGRLNPMQGQSPNRAQADPLYYPGDDNIHEGRVQLQAHLVRPRDTDLVTTALALYIPEGDPRYDLRYVVRDQRR